MKRFLIVAALALAGCATTPTPDGAAVETSRTYSAYEPFRARSAETGIVVIKRDRGFTGAACATRVYVNGAHVADLRPGERVTLHLPLSHHVLSADAPPPCGGGMSEVAVDVLAGQPRAFRVGASSSMDTVLSPTAF